MRIIPVASGKGGVGKSLLSANLAIALGEAGKSVLLADLDLGASNLHLVLGVPSPKAGIGTFLTGATPFEDCVMETSWKGVSFVAGDSEIPGLTALRAPQKSSLTKNILKSSFDFVILDLGAGTHTGILDFFMMSHRGIVVTAPTVTATLNAYLFLKNAVFRLMYTTFKKGTPARDWLDGLKGNSAALRRMYIPKIIEEIARIDPESARAFRERSEAFRPRLVMNMIDDPKDADKALKIRRSCREYLNIDLEHLGVIYRDAAQDIALASRLPVIVYKPQSVLSQAVYRIADKILQDEGQWDDAEDADEIAALSEESFQTAELEANVDFDARMNYVEELVGSGALSMGDLAETIKSQQYELTALKKENALLKSKIAHALMQGFKL